MSANASAGDVWVIAHRGASREYPENTRAAFDAALDQGCDAIELDLQLSRDGVPVVYHDRTLSRAGGGRRRVAQLDLAELRRLDAGARGGAPFRGQKILTLAEVLERYAGHTVLLLEVKTREGRAGAERHLELARAAGSMVRQLRLERHAMMLCFDPDVLNAAAATAPRLRRVLNLRPGSTPDARLRRLLPSLWALSADVRTLTPRFAAAVRRAGRPILAFTCNTPAAVRRALCAGALGIMTDRPDWLRERLGAAGGQLMERDFERLREGSFDLLVIGGGIYGAWTAYDAALRGMRVALVERSDWGSGSSSASSKLIHGGLRYLPRGQIGVVRKSLQERRRLERLGPHRVRPLRFVLPVYGGSLFTRAKLKLGLWLYDRLAPRKRSPGPHHAMGRGEMLQRFDLLEPRGMTGGFTFGDCRTDDARFTLEIVDGAVGAGATVVNRASVVEVLVDGGRAAGAVVRDEETGETIEVHAQVTVSCAGAWTDRLIESHRPGKSPLTRRSKGIHLVMPALPSERAFMLLTRSHGGVVFMIPWYGRTLLGTTDTEFTGVPEDARVEDDDVSYLLARANAVLRDVSWESSDVLASFVGLRTFPAASRGPSTALSREWLVEEPLPHLFVSVGGKITSARADAAFLVHKINGRLGRQYAPCPTLELAFPWRPQEHFRSWFGRALDRGLSVGLDEETAQNCLYRYGSRSERLFEMVSKLPRLAERIVPEMPFCLGEIIYAAKYEMARTLEDVFTRRIPLALVASPPEERVRLAAKVLGKLHGWPEPRVGKAIDEFCSSRQAVPAVDEPVG